MQKESIEYHSFLITLPSIVIKQHVWFCIQCFQYMYINE